MADTASAAVPQPESPGQNDSGYQEYLAHFKARQQAARPQTTRQRASGQGQTTVGAPEQTTPPKPAEIQLPTITAPDAPKDGKPVPVAVSGAKVSGDGATATGSGNKIELEINKEITLPSLGDALFLNLLQQLEAINRGALSYQQWQEAQEQHLENQTAQAREEAARGRARDHIAQSSRGEKNDLNDLDDEARQYLPSETQKLEDEAAKADGYKNALEQAQKDYGATPENFANYDSDDKKPEGQNYGDWLKDQAAKEQQAEAAANAQKPLKQAEKPQPEKTDQEATAEDATKPTETEPAKSEEKPEETPEPEEETPNNVIPLPRAPRTPPTLPVGGARPKGKVLPFRRPQKPAGKKPATAEKSTEPPTVPPENTDDVAGQIASDQQKNNNNTDLNKIDPDKSDLEKPKTALEGNDLGAEGKPGKKPTGDNNETPEAGQPGGNEGGGAGAPPQLSAEEQQGAAPGMGSRAIQQSKRIRDAVGEIDNMFSNFKGKFSIGGPYYKLLKAIPGLGQLLDALEDKIKTVLKKLGEKGVREILSLLEKIKRLLKLAERFEAVAEGFEEWLDVTAGQIVLTDEALLPIILTIGLILALPFWMLLCFIFPKWTSAVAKAIEEALEVVNKLIEILKKLLTMLQSARVAKTKLKNVQDEAKAANDNEEQEEEENQRRAA